MRSSWGGEEVVLGPVRLLRLGPRRALPGEELDARLLHPPALRHVGGDEDARAMLAEADGGGGELDIELVAVLGSMPPHSELAPHVARGAGRERGHVGGRLQVPDPHGEELVPAVAVAQDSRFVHGENVEGLDVEHPGGQGSPLEEQPMARLGFAKRLLGATEPDERAHSGDEHGRLRGLGQIAVGAAVQAAHGVAAVHEGGGDQQD